MAGRNTKVISDTAVITIVRELERGRFQFSMPKRLDESQEGVGMIMMSRSSVKVLKELEERGHATKVEYIANKSSKENSIRKMGSTKRPLTMPLYQTVFGH